MGAPPTRVRRISAHPAGRSGRGTDAAPAAADEVIAVDSKILSVAGEGEKIKIFSLSLLPFGALRESKVVERVRLHGDAVAWL